MTRINAFFKPPCFEDEEKTRQAFLLHIILWTLLLVAILYFVYALLFYQEVTRRVLTQVFVGVVVNAFLLIMVRRGYVRSASIIQIAAFWIFFTVTAWTAAGVHHQAYQIGYALGIVIAGVLIGLRGALIMVGVSLLSGGLMVVISDKGSWSFKSPDKALDVWVISAIMFPILVVIQYLGERLIRITLAQTRISEERYRTIIEEMDNGYNETDLSGNITFCNDAFLRNTGFSREELIGTNYSRYAVEEKDAKKVWNAYKKMYKTGIPVRALEVNMFIKDGTKRNIEIYASLLRDSDNRPTSFRGIIRDITDRKHAEEKLRQSEDRLDKAMAVKNEGIWDWNIVTNETFFDDRHYTMAGYAPNEFPNNFKAWTERIHPDDLPGANSAIQDYFFGKSGSLTTEFRLKHKNGSWLWIQGQGKIAARDANGKPLRMIGTHTDITKRREVQEELRKSEEKYRLILENIQEGYYEVDLAGNMTFFNNAMALIADCPPEELIGMNYRFYTSEKTLKEVFATFNHVFRTGNPSTGFDWEIIRKSGEPRHIEASVSLLKDTSGKPTGFRGLVRDITERKRAEEQLHLAIETLKKSVGTTIQVMVSAVEMRDPYTAGHQIRVASLAGAIATEMGLAQEKIEGIHMAGSIHDIGKLSIPSELLSKPTKLTDIEFALVKDHARSGYEILKDVESPWPLAQIAYQHHERMNGSGYPRNLKGEEILMEARIMAVSDVVEAMASHRPYRPGFGIDVALAEIEKDRGTYYDNTVVDACLRLFREKGYQLPAV